MKQLSKMLLALALPALANAAANAADSVPPPSVSDPSCACIAQGKRFGQGETACINGIRMLCGMNQNMSSWLSKGEQCQVSFKNTSSPRSGVMGVLQLGDDGLNLATSTSRRL